MARSYGLAIVNTKHGSRSSRRARANGKSWRWTCCEPPARWSRFTRIRSSGSKRMWRTLRDMLCGRPLYAGDTRADVERMAEDQDKQHAEDETAELRARVAHHVRQRRIRQRGYTDDDVV